MAELRTDAERLLAVKPEEFVEERARIARRLRDEGRAEDARAVAGTKKPPLVVLAVNRAASVSQYASARTGLLSSI